MTQEIITGTVMLIISILLIANPNFIWDLSEKWTQKKPSEPTKAYIVILRIVGFIFAFVGILLIYGIIA